MKLKDLCELYNIKFTKGHIDETIKRISKEYEIIKKGRGDYEIIRELTEEEKAERKKYKKRTISNPRIGIDEIKSRCKKYNLIMLNESEYKGKRTKISVIDNEGYKYLWNTSYLNKITGNIKSRISKSNPYQVENANLWLKLHDINTKILYFDWSGSHPYAICLCECGNTYKAQWSRVLSGKNITLCCDICKKNIVNPKKYSYDFVKETLLNNGYILLDNEYKGNNNNLLCINNEGYRVKIKFSNIINKTKNKPYIFSPIYNSENYIYNINRYFKINDINCEALYYKWEDDKYTNDIPTIYCKCECGEIFHTNFSAIKSGQYRCQKCSSSKSKLELKVQKWLDSKHIEYECQKKFKECKDLRALPFDFYLPKYNACIEVDGNQHNEMFPFGNMNKKEYLESEQSKIDLEYRQRHDKIKNDFCLNNNIKLIRIPQNKIERRHEEYKTILYENLIKK